MARNRSTHPKKPGKSLAIGILAAPLVIPLLPIILPLVLLYYSGVIVRLLARKVRP